MEKVEKSTSLPEDAGAYTARASMADGVLTVTIRAPQRSRGDGRRASSEGA